MGRIGPQGKLSTRDTEHRECSDGMGGDEGAEHNKARNAWPTQDILMKDADETNQGRSEQSQKSETQMEGVGHNATG